MKRLEIVLQVAGLLAFSFLPARSDTKNNFDATLGTSSVEIADNVAGINTLKSSKYNDLLSEFDFSNDKQYGCRNVLASHAYQDDFSFKPKCDKYHTGSNFTAEDKTYLDIFNFARGNGIDLYKGNFGKLKQKFLADIVAKSSSHISQYSSNALKSLPFILNASVDLDIGLESDLKFGLSAIYKVASFPDKEVPEFDQSIIFGQTKVIGTASSGSTWNIGIGGRKIINDNVMAGLNAFWDYRITPYDVSHSRFGLGNEFFWKNLELRNNWYIAGTGPQDVTINSVAYVERVVPGWDLEIGYRPESLPELALFARAFRWDYQYGSDNSGLELAANYQLNPHTNFEAYTSNEIPAYPGSLNDDIQHNEWLFGLRVKYSIKPVILKKSSTYKERFQALMKQPVRRRYDVLLERKRKSTGFSVGVSGR